MKKPLEPGRETVSLADHVHEIAAWSVSAAAVVWLVGFGQPVLIPLVGAIVLTLTATPIVRWVHHHLPIRRPIAAFVVLAALAGVTLAVTIASFGPAVAWLGALGEQVTDPARWEGVISEQVANHFTGVLSRMLGPLLMGTTSAVVTLAMTIVIAMFLLMSGDGLMRRVVLLTPTFSGRRQAVRIARSLESGTARYVVTLTAINAAEFVVVSLLLWALGVPKPWALGLIAGLFNFVPYLGPVLAAALIFASAAVDSGELGVGLLAVTAFLAVNVTEAYFISPWVYGNRLRINPVAIIVGVLVGSWLWGVAGALLAMPMLVITRIACENAACLQPVGLFLTDRPQPFARRGRWRQRQRVRRRLSAQAGSNPGPGVTPPTSPSADTTGPPPPPPAPPTPASR